MLPRRESCRVVLITTIAQGRQSLLVRWGEVAKAIVERRFDFLILEFFDFMLRPIYKIKKLNYQPGRSKLVSFHY